MRWSCCLRLDPGVGVACWGCFFSGDALDVSLGGLRHEAFPGRVMAPLVGVRAGGRFWFLHEEPVECLRIVFDYLHELTVRGSLDHAQCHEVASGRRGVAETEQKCYRGAPHVALRREVPLSERSCHVIIIGKGKATLVLPRLLGSKGDAELVPKPLVVEADGGKRLDGAVRSYQLSSHRDDEI